jgi:hypothetical protein
MRNLTVYTYFFDMIRIATSRGYLRMGMGKLGKTMTYVGE